MISQDDIGQTKFTQWHTDEFKSSNFFTRLIVCYLISLRFFL